MIKAVIVDDELIARQTLSDMLLLYCKNINLIGVAEDVQSGLKIINDKKPDLVFLDIQMTDGTGFDLLQKLDKIEFKIIFVTAFEEYAIKAFKFSALDYLL